MPLLRRTPRFAAGDLIEVGGHGVRLKVNGRARRVSLRVDASAREVVATAPSLKRLGDAAAFAETRASWIAERLASLPIGVAFAPGQVIEAQGEPLRLERAAMRIPPRIIPSKANEPARLLASGEGAAYARAVERGLRAWALQTLSDRTAVHCATLGKPAPTLAVMAARGRWGSCRQPFAGEPARIRYNWRLVLTPPAVLDYVAAHEVAHLVEANHSPAYWAVVRALYGDPRVARAWLRREGARIQAMGA